MVEREQCLFCRIADGAVPAEVVLQTATTVAFRDVNPQAPAHVLVIPRAHHDDVAALACADPELMAQVMTTVAAVAESQGLTDAGYRVTFNTGRGAGQTVFHVHAHVLGGRAFTWPPG